MRHIHKQTKGNTIKRQEKGIEREYPKESESGTRRWKRTKAGKKKRRG